MSRGNKYGKEKPVDYMAPNVVSCAGIIWRWSSAIHVQLKHFRFPQGETFSRTYLIGS